MEQLITRQSWVVLVYLLQRGDLSDQQRRHIIEEVTGHHQETTSVRYILLRCAGDDLVYCAERLIEQRPRMTLGKLLKRGGLSDEQSRHIIEKVVEHGDEVRFCSKILPHCARDELHHMIPQFITRGWWRALGKLLQRGALSDEQRRLITDDAEQRRQMIEHAVEENVMTCILPHCAPDEVDHGITLLITWRCWQALGKLLQRGALSDDQRRRIIRETTERPGETTPISYILQHCTRRERNYCIQRLIARQSWVAVGEILQRSGLGNKQRRFVIREVLEHGDEVCFCSDILPHCVGVEPNHVIPKFIRRGWWQTLGKLLQRGGLSDEQRELITGDAEQRKHMIEHAEEENVMLCILPHCAPGELDYVIPQLITRGWWQISGT